MGFQRSFFSLPPFLGHQPPIWSKKHTKPSPRGLPVTLAPGTPQEAKNSRHLKITDLPVAEKTSHQPERKRLQGQRRESRQRGHLCSARVKTSQLSPQTQAPGPAERVTVAWHTVVRPDQEMPASSQTTAQGDKCPQVPRDGQEPSRVCPQRPPTWSCLQRLGRPTTCGTGSPPSLRGCSALGRYSGMGGLCPRAGREGSRAAARATSCLRTWYGLSDIHRSGGCRERSATHTYISF